MVSMSLARNGGRPKKKNSAAATAAAALSPVVMGADPSRPVVHRRISFIKGSLSSGATQSHAASELKLKATELGLEVHVVKTHEVSFF